MGVEGTAEVFNEVRQGSQSALVPPPMIRGSPPKSVPSCWVQTVKSSNVKVTTENGEVFLLGLVTDREGKAAADIASRVSGVKHVTTAFTYINHHR